MDAITQGAAGGSATSAGPIITEPLTSVPPDNSFDDIAKLFSSPPAADSPSGGSVAEGQSGSFSFVHEGEDVLGRAAQMVERAERAPVNEPPDAPSPPNDLPLAALSALGREPSAAAAPSPFLENLTLAEPASAPPPAPEPPAPEPPVETPPATDASTAFVTETMAELYVQQGHQDLAIDVYRQLIKIRPNDTSLTSRLRELEGGAEPAAAANAEPPAPEVIAEAGPTIRDFLVAIAEFRPRADGASVNGANSDHAADLWPATVPALPVKEETVGGSLHNLFSGAERGRPADAPASESIVGVTTPMPSADLPVNEPEPIPGRPTAPATSELSLDHVFRHATPAAGTGAQSNFSFDQFFSQQAQQDVTAADVEPSSDSGAGEGDDIQQFNAWLEGLKKT
jgi:hypothetical protein